MKTNVLLIAALFMFSAGVSAVAKEDPSKAGFAVVPVKGSDVYKVIYKNENSSRVKLNLYNSFGQVIFSETISADGFIRPLNFTGLGAGEYTVEVNDGASKRVEKISHHVAPAEVSVSGSKVVHVSKIKGADEKYVLSIANALSENFVVRIFDANENVIFTETTKVENSDAKIYFVKNQKVAKIEVTDASGTKVVKNF